MNKLTTFSIIFALSLPTLAAEYKFTDIFEAGFYAPLEEQGREYKPGEKPLGAKYFPAGCEKEFEYYAYIQPDRIGTPFSMLPRVPTYQIYKLSDEGKTLSVDLKFKGHDRIQATLKLKDFVPDQKLVYEGVYTSPITQLNRLATMTFEKIGANGIRGYAKVGHITHGEFLLKRVKSQNEAYLMFAQMAATNAGPMMVAQIKSLCGQRPKKDEELKKEE